MLMAVCDFCNKMKYTDRVTLTAVGLTNKLEIVYYTWLCVRACTCVLIKKFYNNWQLHV